MVHFFNPESNHNYESYAKEIANLLDQKESVEQTRGDGKIEGSIWAKYSGRDEADNISQNDAEKVIASDLKEKGVDFMRGLLHGMGIEWKPKSILEKILNGEDKNKLQKDENNLKTTDSAVIQKIIDKIKNGEMKFDNGNFLDKDVIKPLPYIPNQGKDSGGINDNVRILPYVPGQDNGYDGSPYVEGEHDGMIMYNKNINNIE